MDNVLSDYMFLLNIEKSNVGDNKLMDQLVDVFLSKISLIKKPSLFGKSLCCKLKRVPKHLLKISISHHVFRVLTGKNIGSDSLR